MELFEKPSLCDLHFQDRQTLVGDDLELSSAVSDSRSHRSTELRQRKSDPRGYRLH